MSILGEDVLFLKVSKIYIITMGIATFGEHYKVFFYERLSLSWREGHLSKVPLKLATNTLKNLLLGMSSIEIAAAFIIESTSNSLVFDERQLSAASLQ